MPVNRLGSHTIVLWRVVDSFNLLAATLVFLLQHCIISPIEIQLLQMIITRIAAHGCLGSGLLRVFRILLLVCHQAL